jgi:hypothetical protein
LLVGVLLGQLTTVYGLVEERQYLRANKRRSEDLRKRRDTGAVDSRLFMTE